MKLTKEEIGVGPDNLWTTKENYRNKDGGKMDQEATVDEDGDAEKEEYKMELVWPNIMVYIIFHTGALYGFYLGFTVAKWATIAWSVFLVLFCFYGITGGAHRLWSHRSYKAKWPVRLYAAFGQTLAAQNHIYEWCRDHRVHHKFSETDADPHDARRGFFFAHVGWLLCRKHPAVARRGKTVDMSDLLDDPIVVYQRKYYVPLVLSICFAIPTFVPWYYWGETLNTSFFVAAIARHIWGLNITWLVNSAGHLWGGHPYERNINPAENRFVSFFAFGEGWHNYHHVFPWDYKTSELGDYRLNFTTALIDFFAWLGLAYDLKTVPKKVVYDRVHRTGDGTHPYVVEEEKLDNNNKQT